MTETERCTVCSEPLTPTTEAWCSSCGRAYHLNQRSDRPGKDCGQVWINDEHLALEFACDSCLHPPSDLEQVMDITEAATAAGVSVEHLRAEARAGRVPHRETAGGVLLFVRRDILRLRDGNG